MAAWGLAEQSLTKLGSKAIFRQQLSKLGVSKLECEAGWW